MSAPESLTADQALVRLGQYREHTSAWSTATYNDGTERALAQIAEALATEVERLRGEPERLAEIEEAARLRDEAEQLRAEVEAAADPGRGLPAEVARLRLEVDRVAEWYVEAAAALAEQVQRYGRLQREHNADREKLEQLRAELAARPSLDEVLRNAAGWLEEIATPITREQRSEHERGQMYAARRLRSWAAEADGERGAPGPVLPWAADMADWTRPADELTADPELGQRVTDALRARTPGIVPRPTTPGDADG